jgi:hypothetical protein
MKNKNPTVSLKIGVSTVLSQIENRKNKNKMKAFRMKTMIRLMKMRIPSIQTKRTNRITQA